MSTTLYVIGNGFDLWHGIPSSLGAFKAYVQETENDIHREVEDYLPAGEDWCDLELALAALDADMLVDNLGHFMGSYGDDEWSDAGHHDFQYKVGNVVERLSTGLRTRFADWIRTLPITTSDTAPRRLTRLDRQALFLSFNYTRTLSSLYGVDPAQVLHIHGRADETGEELILGHAWNPQSRRSLNDRPDIEEIDTRLTEANDIIDEYFSNTFKRSEELIVRYRDFFDALTAVEEVVVLGHSLSTVDAAYFRALLRQPGIAQARWTVACRSLQEWPDKEQRLTDIGLRPGASQPVPWDAL
ncbi:TPA: bacteriophage abortive infection AbiH family protein [Stenotrophomonas maltophilia]|uniref:bacteriophage abortive infection AbiH family protein n=1 Tax=Cupriavidus pauculus TaxID=82633 RepID=UPI0007839AF3|nr:bacteriophage abortive infection AbiH family protein [Cupriavidus pauculus]HDS1530813.1 bacteriophage abortive infection AbiH family protein [Stenotrophomonas maltophilia]